MNNHSSSSRLISVDGIDGVGKSTQIQRLAEFLTDRGHDVLCVRDPGSTEIGKRLRALLLDSDLHMHRRTEAMLFMASRSEMIETVIRPALESGQTVISDRFLLANVVYQSVGNDGAPIPEVSSEQLWAMGRLACGGLSPGLTLLLDLPVEDALSRLEGQVDRMESRGVQYFEAVRKAFIAELPNTGGTGRLISAAGSAEDVADRINEAVNVHFGEGHKIDRSPSR